jgi:hypothetical protein
VCRVCSSYRAAHLTAYYVAFGPHGPRAPVNPPGTVVKILTGVSVLIGSASLIYAGVRSIGMLVLSIFHRTVLTLAVLYFFFNTQLPRHQGRSTRSGKRPPMSVQRNSKSIPFQVRISVSFFFAFPSHVFLLLTTWGWHAGISSEGYAGKGFVTHK